MENVPLKSNSRHPATINDVATLAGVSIATVSRVINGTTPVSKNTADRVREAINTLSFTPHSAARILATRKTHTIGLILPEISGSYFTQLLRGIEAGIRGTGYDLLVHSAVTNQDTDEFPSVRLGEHNTDGLLVFPKSIQDSELQRLHNRNFPVVLMHQTSSRDLSFPMVTVENKAGAKKLVDHLIEIHDKKRIVFLKGPDGHEDSYWRERGYRLALESHGIPCDPNLVAYGGFNEDQAYASVQRMIDNGVEMDAVFAGDDDSAMGVYRALKSNGRHIPGDTAVVGFDDVDFSQYTSPTLTTIHAPIESVGHTAVCLLMQCIQEEECEPVVLLPTELVIRESCGCRK